MRSESPQLDFVISNKARRWPDIERLDESHIRSHPHRFVGGRNSWIAQTYVRLRPTLEARGWRARVTDRFHPGSISIVHRDDANQYQSAAAESFLVVVRADRPPVRACDVAIVQNALAPSGKERFLPLWPQPGLHGRDPRRGTGIQRLAYHGRTGSAPSWFSDRAFIADLRRRGVEFEVKTSGWEDYQFVDLAIAVRDDVPVRLRSKPATKLYNAWLAGVPMLASPEPAYKELRRSPIDFLEVHDPRAVLEAIDLLRANPGLYSAMITNGRARGREFDVDAVRERWLALLEREILPAYAAARARLGRRQAWYVGAMARQKGLSRMHRIGAGLQRMANARWVPRGILADLGRALAAPARERPRAFGETLEQTSVLRLR